METSTDKQMLEELAQAVTGPEDVDTLLRAILCGKIKECYEAYKASGQISKTC